MQETKKIALITGATSGIGLAIARRLAKLNYDLILTGRRKEKLETISEELGKKYPIRILPQNFDVRDLAEVEKYLGGLTEEWKNIDVLVNNAGLAAGLEPIYEGSIENWERMIDTNIKGLLYVTKTVSPYMISRGKGHIFNISSIAGKEVYPCGNVYCATKHAVDALSKAMRIDMVRHGIKVTNIAPGAVETEFSNVRFNNDEKKIKATYAGYTPLTGDDIASCVESVLLLPDNICINDMVITPKAQAGSRDFFKK